MFLGWANNAACERPMSQLFVVSLFNPRRSYLSGPAGSTVVGKLHSNTQRMSNPDLPFSFLFPEMRQFLLNSQHVESSLYILFEQSWLPVWGEAPLYTPQPCLSCSLDNPTFLQIKMISQAANSLIRCPLSGGRHMYTLCRGGNKRCGV